VAIDQPIDVTVVVTRPRGPVAFHTDRVRLHSADS
jgi:hypothetical protein